MASIYYEDLFDETKISIVQGRIILDNIDGTMTKAWLGNSYARPNMVPRIEEDHPNFLVSHGDIFRLRQEVLEINLADKNPPKNIGYYIRYNKVEGHHPHLYTDYLPTQELFAKLIDYVISETKRYKYKMRDWALNNILIDKENIGIVDLDMILADFDYYKVKSEISNWKINKEVPSLELIKKLEVLYDYHT